MLKTIQTHFQFEVKRAGKLEYPLDSQSYKVDGQRPSPTIIDAHGRVHGRERYAKGKCALRECYRCAKQSSIGMFGSQSLRSNDLADELP